MKLRNKKTGEIGELLCNPSIINRYFVANDEGNYSYDSLAELNEEWEDYEEPKGMWAVGEFGELYEVSGLALNRIEKLKEIGNCFETEEEAEKAVEKLKALKRLKDKGFRFVGWRGDNDKHHLDGVAWYEMRLCGGYDIETANDLETIFGPEEKE